MIDDTAAGDLLSKHFDDLIGSLEHAVARLDDSARDIAGDIARLGNGR